jgi:hypothetical protein
MGKTIPIDDSAYKLLSSLKVGRLGSSAGKKVLTPLPSVRLYGEIVNDL